MLSLWCVVPSVAWNAEHVVPCAVCSALQGLLRKLGANFEDMLPMGAGGPRMKVRQCQCYLGTLSGR